MTCWTQALHEYLVASPPEGEDEDAIRALLCTPRRQIDQVPKTLASTLRAWLARSTELSCRYALSSALPYTEDFNRLGGPLLAWGLTRPWNKAIQFQQTLENWHGVLNEPGVFSDALPSTERERLEQLPLATHPDDAEALNRALFQLYCPEMYPLMELAMTDGDWCARETIESWVTRLENIETEAFALPPDSPENNMAN